MRRDIGTLGLVAFRLAHELSEAALALESAPGLAQRRWFSTQMSDAAITVLTQVAAAQHELGEGSIGRLRASSLVRSARSTLNSLSVLMKQAESRGYVTASLLEAPLIKVDELAALLLALSMEMRATSRTAAW
ncbi:MAG: hypothetical protein HYX53_17285 [Chloroflexi bacterium]|nr:hypothetical protein [Chloroflexota bacterium]